MCLTIWNDSSAHFFKVFMVYFLIWSIIKEVTQFGVCPTKYPMISFCHVHCCHSIFYFPNKMNCWFCCCRSYRMRRTLKTPLMEQLNPRGGGRRRKKQKRRVHPRLRQGAKNSCQTHLAWEYGTALFIGPNSNWIYWHVHHYCICLIIDGECSASRASHASLQKAESQHILHSK